VDKNVQEKNWILDHFHNFQPTHEIKPKFHENHEYQVLLDLKLILFQFWKFFRYLLPILHEIFNTGDLSHHISRSLPVVNSEEKPILW
jgi:hypothetical protein